MRLDEHELLDSPGAADNASLRGDVWRGIEQWLDEALRNHWAPQRFTGL